MAIALRPFDALDPDVVAAVLAQTVQRISEDNPRLELRRGVFAEQLAYYHAVLDAQRVQNINDYLAARSLKQIEADPTLADPDLVDDVISNFRVTRKPGRLATGDVTVVVSSDVNVVIPKGSVWEANGRQFVTPAVYTAKLEAAQVSLPGDRLLTPVGPDTWAFNITLEAVATGTEYAVRKDSLVVPTVIPPAYVTSYAAGDFADGLSAETNAELLARLQEGVAAKALSNRVNMAAMLREIDAFSRVVAMSVIGHGDAELVRAYHSILPIALGNRCDWYVRATELLPTLSLSKTCTLLEKGDDGVSVWQFSVGRDEAPGFYEFVDVRPAGTVGAVGGFFPDADVRGLDMTGTGFKPDVLTAVEAAYSAFSTAVVTFTDTTSDVSALTVGDTAEYEVGVRCLGLIGEIQSTVSSRDVRNYGGDCLVKAPVPCFLSVSFTVYKVTGQADPDLSAVREAVARAANTGRFSGKVYASQIQDAVYAYLADGQRVSAIDMLGRLRYPDGSTHWVRSSEVVSAPDDPDNMVTARTVQFFTAPEDVGVTVVTGVASDV